uniref:Uncharacterized protein n=1 Tax=Oryza sativa subsp. japonica TaxID=39947 RepID=Q67WL4_ORYSJ|nr:hypothetical protein [Oryza sativa Japonica Group]BAD37455.1 hypothetical protein [Oryza sativa Japonica Group]
MAEILGSCGLVVESRCSGDSLPPFLFTTFLLLSLRCSWPWLVGQVSYSAAGGVSDSEIRWANHGRFQAASSSSGPDFSAHLRSGLVGP